MLFSPSVPIRIIPCPSRAAFTLVELLATVAIIGMLVALLFPTAQASIRRAQSSKCQSTLRQFGTAAVQYTTDNNGMALPAVVYTTPTGGNNWPSLLRPYLGASDLYDKSRDASFTCPAMAKNSSNAWAWGYGINARPGYHGSTTVYPDNRLSYQNSPVTWFGPYQSLLVTNQARRALILDGDNWQIDASQAIQSSGAALNRHGTNKCNVLFYDGHVESLAPNDVYKSIYDPANS